MKSLLFILLVSFFVLSCSSLKPATSSPDLYKDQQKPSSIKFIDNISINGQSHNSATSASRIKPQQFNSPSLNGSINYGFSIIETYSLLQFKYAILADVPVEEM
ncbi:MAG TPA: hypothetical protein VK787_08120, partial [Puia sp.]|nr:hypothetical protein [Puia sp.]